MAGTTTLRVVVVVATLGSSAIHHFMHSIRSLPVSLLYSTPRRVAYYIINLVHSASHSSDSEMDGATIKAKLIALCGATDQPTDRFII